MKEEAWKEDGYACNRTTGEILMVMELSCIFSVAVDSQNYPYGKILQLQIHTQMSTSKTEEI